MHLCSSLMRDSRKIFPKMATSQDRIGCANCLVYNWKQPEPAILKKCTRCKMVQYFTIITITIAIAITITITRCKVVQYCGKACQQEHWVKVQ